jgi:argininosuccinate lyase
MSDDQRATLSELLGRQRDPERAQSRRDVATIRDPDGPHGRLWLVLAAHLRGLERTGVIDERSAAALAGALDRARGDHADAGSSLRRLADALEERVDAAAPAELAAAATLGLAAEDWTATATRIGLRNSALAALAAACAMQGSLLAMAELHPITLMQGFHTGSPAQPVTFAHLLGGAIGPVGEAVERGIAALDRLDRSPLGAGSMAGEVVGGERIESAAALGFTGTIPNTFDAVANVEDLVGALDAIAAVSAPVARLLGELATLVRTDPTSLVFDDELMREDARLPGFSAAEGLLALADDLRSVTADAGALTQRLRAIPYGPLGAALDWIDRDATIRFGEATAALGRVDSLFRHSLTINRAYLANRAGRGYTTSNDLAAFLMAEEGLPPSVARNIASLAMRRLREERIEMSAITPEALDTAAMLVIGRELKVEPETLGRWFAPRRFLERRLVEGSPAPAMTREWLEAELSRNRRSSATIADRQARVSDAEAAARRWVEERASEHAEG